jgi:hypothetical protein
MAEMKEKKQYTQEEIKKLAPGYKGRPENFDPTKVGKKNIPKPSPRQGRGPTSAILPPATHLQTKSTPQRNESLITEAIFGVDVSVVEIAPIQSFAANYSRVVDIAAEVYDGYRVDEKQLDRVVAREEVAYYATAMMHLKLLEVKAKQGEVSLTSKEKDIRKAVSDKVWNIPQPLCAYLQEIGTYSDKMGRETRLEVPPLPVAVSQGFGGYHAPEINVDTHNMFEEIPSLGIAGDMVMALASLEAEPVPNFHIGVPVHSEVTANLAGSFFPIGQQRPEIRQRLAGYGITTVEFSEYVSGTRFNLRYIKSLSDILGRFDTYRAEKVTFRNLSLSGGETQTIKSRPSEVNEPEGWRTRSVQPSSLAIMGASYCYGFQLFKEDGPGATRAQRTANWSCISGVSETPWQMPDDWYNNRNDRRNLPDGIGTERFRAISIRQDLQMSNTVRRMIKTSR